METPTIIYLARLSLVRLRVYTNMIDNDLSSLIEEFNRINLGDIEEVRNWFRKYPELTYFEHCKITGKSLWYVSNLKKRVGMNPVYIVETEDEMIIRHPNMPKPQNHYKLPDLDIPPNWRTKEWLEDNYVNADISTRQLARAVGLSIKRTRTILESIGVPIKKYDQTVKSQSPYCSETWLREHYINKGLSLRECARIANVTHSTIKRWLMKYGLL